MPLLGATAVRPWGKAILTRGKVQLLITRHTTQNQVLGKFEVRMTSYLITVRMVIYHAESLLNISDGLHFVGWCISGQTDCTDRP